MNPEEYIIIKKSDLLDLKLFFKRVGKDDIFLTLENNNPDYVMYIKELQPLLEETFEESKRQHDWAGGHIYGKGKYGQEEEDLTDWKYPNFEDFIKQKEI